MFFKTKKYSEAQKQGAETANAGKTSLFSKVKKTTAIIVFCFFLYSTAKLFLYQHHQLTLLNEQRKEIENEIINIQDLTRNLQEEIIKLHDKEYIEHFARKEYGMVGEDDLVFVPAREIED